MNVNIRGAEIVTSAAAGTSLGAAGNGAGKCRMYSLRVFNRSAAAIYAQVHDSVDLPTDMTTLRYELAVPVQVQAVDEISGGLPFEKGCWIYMSTASNALTAITTGAAVMMVTVRKERA